MDTKTTIVIFLTCLCNFLSGQQTSNSTYRGIQKFISGDFDESVMFYTKAIEEDSTAFENYYLRGLALAFLSDTSNCIKDFFKAIDLKRKFIYVPTDTLVSDLLSRRPTRSALLCSRSLDNQSDLFFQVWLGTWLMLTGTDKEESCENLTHAEVKGLRQLKPYRLKYCR